MAMWAAQSGKDMYIEKPGAMSINEIATPWPTTCGGTASSTSRARRGRISMRSSSRWVWPAAASSGRLTAVHADTAIGLGTVDAGGHGWWAEEKPEPDPLVFDWDKWLGPCLWRPYNSNYTDRGRGEFWDFHAGLLEWASHTVAMAQWAADMEYTEPVEYIPGGADLPRRRPDRAIHDSLPLRQRRATRSCGIIAGGCWDRAATCSKEPRAGSKIGDSGRIEVSDESQVAAAERSRGRATTPLPSTFANSSIASVRASLRAPMPK